MLDKFRDDSKAFFRGNDSEAAYNDMVNSGLLILTRAYHANHGFDTPNADDMEAVSTVLSWMVRQDAIQVTEGTYAAKAEAVAHQLVAKGGLSDQDEADFIEFARLSRQNTYTPNSDADLSGEQPAHG